MCPLIITKDISSLPSFIHTLVRVNDEDVVQISFSFTLISTNLFSKKNYYIFYTDIKVKVNMSSPSEDGS